MPEQLVNRHFIKPKKTLFDGDANFFVINDFVIRLGLHQGVSRLKTSKISPWADIIEAISRVDRTACTEV